MTSPIPPISSPGLEPLPKEFKIQTSTQRATDASGAPSEQLKIVMKAKDPEFLEKAWKSITEYTRKINPEATFEPMNIIQLEREDKQGFTHAMTIQEILPPLVRALYGKNKIASGNGNCHGAALLAAGLMPIMSNLQSGVGQLKITQEKTHEIAISDRQPGDLILINGHSFVFLNDDISLSMNGESKYLKLHATSKILKKYNYPADFFKKPNQPIGASKKIEIRRINTDWHLSEKIQQISLDFINFAKRGMMMSYEYPEYAYHLKKFDEYMSEEFDSKLSTPAEKAALAWCYHKVTNSMMPYPVVKESNYYTNFQARRD